MPVGGASAADPGSAGGRASARDPSAARADEVLAHRLRLDHAAAADALKEVTNLLANFNCAQSGATRSASDKRWQGGHEFGDNAALGRAIVITWVGLALAPLLEGSMGLA